MRTLVFIRQQKRKPLNPPHIKQVFSFAFLWSTGVYGFLYQMSFVD